MKKAFLFDVDGTLSESRKIMDHDFREEFIEFAQTNDVFLVTGSDRPKTVEQTGVAVYGACKGVFQCNGNEKWVNGRMVAKSDFKPDYDFKHFLQNEINRSTYPIKTGNHCEFRTGMCNVSTVGRNCSREQREEYYEWDKHSEERQRFCDRIMHQFPKFTASVGGQISIDIYPVGKNKAQVIQDLMDDGYTNFDFFGDRCEYGGNDFPLAETIRLAKLGTVYNVSSWEQTRQLLLVIGNKLEEKK